MRGAGLLYVGAWEMNQLQFTDDTGLIGKLQREAGVQFRRVCERIML